MKFVIEAVGLTAGGGKELARNLLSRLLRDDNHEFVVLLPSFPESVTHSERNVKQIPCAKAKSLLARYIFLNRTVPRICAQHHADALLCLGNFVPRKPSCPTVLLLQNPWLVYREPPAETRLTFRERLIVAYGRHSFWKLSPQVRVIVQTEIMRQRLISLYKQDPQKLCVIPSSSFLAQASDSTSKPQTRDPGQSFTFLCLARYYAHKNLEVLAQASKKLPAYTRRPFKCIITISAEQHPRAGRLLKRITCENLQNVILNIGPVPRTKLPEVYRSADAFILPTLMETFSSTYSEAMQFGLPILTSDRGFARDRCREAAIYFDPLDSNSVAKSMARIIDDKQLRLQLAENGKRILKEMPTWDEIAAQFVAVLERAATECPTGSLDELAAQAAERHEQHQVSG